MPKRKTSEKNTELTRNEKGQFTEGNAEGNRKGRPLTKLCIPDILKKIGKQEIHENLEESARAMFNIPDGDKLTNLEVVMYKVYFDALKGKEHAILFIANRTEGKDVDYVELTVETMFDTDKLKGLNDEEIRSIIRILTKIRSDEDDQ